MMPAQLSASSVGTRKVRVENLSWEGLCAIDAEPNDLGVADARLIGDLQAEFLLSLLTPPQQAVARLLMEGNAPIEAARIRGVKRLQICRMRKRIKERLAPYYEPRHRHV